MQYTVYALLGVCCTWCMLYLVYVVLGVCCTWCMLYLVYAVLGVCCTWCMLYLVYAVLGVCCTCCMLDSVLTHNDSMGRYREITELCVLRWYSCGWQSERWGWRWDKCGRYKRTREIWGTTFLIVLGRSRIGVTTCQIGTCTCCIRDGK